MLRSLLRSISTAPAKSNLIAAAIATPSQLTSSRTFASKKPKSSGASKKPQQKSKSDPKSKSKQDEIAASSSIDDAAHDVISDEKNRRRLLDEDERDKSLDVGPNGRPLFTSASSLAELNRKDACTYFKFSRKKLDQVLPERLPAGMVKEFDESMRDALLVRHSFLDIRDNFRRVVDPPLQSSTSKGLIYSRFRRPTLGYIFTHQRLDHNRKMKLIQGVIRSLAVGISPSCQGFSVARTLATSSAASVIDTNSSETMEEFDRSVFGDFLSNSLGSSFYQKLDLQKKPSVNYRPNGSGFVDGIDGGNTSLVDGLDLKLKDAATYFEYDVNEVEKDDYKFRPDVTFWSGNTYDVKDLDVTKPGVRKPSKRLEFEVTTKEVLQKADFRNVRFLANFITEAGVIHKRSKTKISAKAQRKVAREIKTARAFGLMPFTTMGTKHFVYGRNMQDQDKDYEYEVYDHNFVDDAP